MARLATAIALLLGFATANELQKAIDADNAAMVNVVLKSGSSKMVNEPGPDGNTPLMYATLQGKHRAFKALLTKGKGDTSIPNADGYTVLHVAAEKGHTKIVQMLITAGANIRERHADGLAPLHRAVMGGHTDAAKAILNAEVPVDDPTAEGKTPMDLAEELDMAVPVASNGRKTPGIKSPQLAMKEVLQKFARTKTEL